MPGINPADPDTSGPANPSPQVESTYSPSFLSNHGYPRLQKLRDARLPPRTTYAHRHYRLWRLRQLVGKAPTSGPKPLAPNLLHHGHRHTGHPTAIVAPGFYSGAKEGIVRIRQDPFVQFLEVSTPSHVYPFLQRNIQLHESRRHPIRVATHLFQTRPPATKQTSPNSPKENTPTESPRPATTSTTSNSTSLKTASPKHPATSHQQPSPA